MAHWMKQWESASWNASVQDWISRVLEAYDVAQAGPLERVSHGLGAIVFSVPTEAGPLYFKAAAPTRTHEAELVSRIAPHSKGLVPQPLAVELDEGWMLSPGLGVTLATQTVPRDPGGWRRVFGEAAALQTSLSAAADELAEGGMPGFLPAAAADYLDTALLRHAQLPAGSPLHISGEDAELLSQGLATVEDATRRLAAVAVPFTLQQGTLDPEQILVPESARASHLFIGWADARWSHPFGLVGEAVQRLCEVHGVEPTQEPVRSTLLAYLDPFSDAAPVAELVELLGPASLVAQAQRHEALMELLLLADPEDQAKHAPEALRLLAGALATPGRASRRSARAGSRGSARQGLRTQASAPPSAGRRRAR